MLGGEEGITFESIHGGDTSLIRAADLDLDRFIPRGGGGPAPIPATELPAAPTAVLLTGANGFLGRFLLLELLQRVSRQCAHIPQKDSYFVMRMRHDEFGSLHKQRKRLLCLSAWTKWVMSGSHDVHLRCEHDVSCERLTCAIGCSRLRRLLNL